jgi:hypothetical protein
MSRTVAVIWHALFSVAAGVLYFFFVLPRWWELSGETSHTLGTVLRIVTGVLIGLAALPVVFTLLRTRRPEYGTPELALRLRLASIVLHITGGVLIVGAAISEIWLSLDSAGRWLFGVYGAAAAICLLGMFAFYLSFIAELPPPPPRPLNKGERKSRWRRGKGNDAAAEAEADAEDEAAGEDADETEDEGEGAQPDEGEKKSDDVEEPVLVQDDQQAEAKDEADDAQAADEEADEAPAEKADKTAADDDKTAADDSSTDEEPSAEDTVAAEASRGGLRNRRPSGKPRRPRLRRKSGGVAVDD